MSESNGKGGLVDFVGKYNFYLLFIVLEAASLTLLFKFNSYQGSVWFSAANSVVSRINGAYTDMVSFFQLREVNSQLTAQNIALQRETDNLRQALITVTKDTTLTEKLMRDKLAGYNLMPATVVSNSAERTNNSHFGSYAIECATVYHNIVVGGGGVVGIVYLTGPHHSLVIPVTNRKSSISCRVRGQNYFGYLQWDGSSMLSAYLDDVPRYAKVKVGQAVETSGYSAVFPPGIFVGRVRAISNSADGQSYRLDVTLGTNFANLRDVLVVTTPYKAEIDTLQVHALQVDDAAQAGK